MRLTVEPERCDLCGACVATCPADMVREKEGRIKIGRVACLACGHCVAVCPTEAIRVEEAAGESLLPTAPPEVTPEHLRRLLLQRRSVRRYEARPVPRQTLEEMLEVARWVPTAANCQCVRYAVILDPVLRDEVAAEVTAFYRAYNEALEDREHTAERLAEIGVNAEFGMHPHMLAAVPAFVKNMERGRDRLFFSAPAVIIVHADRGEVLPQAACYFATFALVMMAETLGLGTCLTAYASEALAALPELRAKLRIPEQNVVYDVVVVGYPAERFQRVPGRKALEVDWR